MLLRRRDAFVHSIKTFFVCDTCGINGYNPVQFPCIFLLLVNEGSILCYYCNNILSRIGENVCFGLWYIENWVIYGKESEHGLDDIIHRVIDLQDFSSN